MQLTKKENKKESRVHNIFGCWVTLQSIKWLIIYLFSQRLEVSELWRIYWGSRDGGWETGSGEGSIVWKECRPASETKEAAAVLSVLVVCPSTKPQANRIPPLPPPPPPTPPPWPLCYTRRERERERGAKIPRREIIRDTEIFGSEVEESRKERADPVVLLRSVRPSPLVEPRRGVCVCVWGVVGEINNPEQRSLEQGKERVETSVAIIFETRPNACVSATAVPRLLLVLQRKPSPSPTESKKEDKNTRKSLWETRRKSAATMFPQNRPPVRRLTSGYCLWYENKTWLPYM